ncbi:MAG: molybdate ABC transporter substrate-binding protein [Thiotrichaceae bacterium]|nr:molybdate ABC transporter substrate-binding protein [Thiotrichaceae bacterium]
MYQKFWIFCCSLLAMPVLADEVHVGAVFSSQGSLSEIVRLFEKTSSDKIIIHQENVTSQSLYQQVKDKADLDIFLSGNVSYPLQLEQEALLATAGRFSYAFGKLVLWSKNPNFVDAKGEVLNSEQFQSIAVLDRKDAPYGYGIATRQVLEKLKLWEKLNPKLIFLDSSAEIQKQVQEGKSELAFLPLATLNPSKRVEGSLWIIPKNYYKPIEQQAVLLKKAENNAAARAFFNYLKSPQAHNILEKYGFSLP